MFYALLAIFSHQVENVLEFIEKWTAYFMRACVFSVSTILAMDIRHCNKHIVVIRIKRYFIIHLPSNLPYELPYILSCKHNLLWFYNLLARFLFLYYYSGMQNYQLVPFALISLMGNVLDSFLVWILYLTF